MLAPNWHSRLLFIIRVTLFELHCKMYLKAANYEKNTLKLFLQSPIMIITLSRPRMMNIFPKSHDRSIHFFFQKIQKTKNNIQIVNGR